MNMDLSKIPNYNRYTNDDGYYKLCDIAGALLQGESVDIYGTTYSGDRARAKGMEVVDLIRVLNRTIGDKSL